MGIDPTLFAIGAYGSDHELRPQLPAIAQRRAREQLGLEMPGRHVIVIGDTPADVECGRDIGARAIGVATGRYPIDVLLAHGAVAAFADLSDTNAVVRADSRRSMIELELKAVVSDLADARRRVEGAGGRLTFARQLEDRRYDRPELSLAAQDHVLRVRIYRDEGGDVKSASIDWKGPTSIESGYKKREEIDSDIAGDPENLQRILERLGFIVSMQIDREIWQYDLHGAVVRFEHYPRMDDLVEIEGGTTDIERAIVVLGIPREACTPERLPDFARRFEERTGRRAALSNAELSGDVRYDVNNA